MSRAAARVLIAMIVSGLAGALLPSLFGERWVFAWSILIAVNIVQAIALQFILPDHRAQS